MKRVSTILGLLTLLSSFAFHTARAYALPPSGQPYVVLVGINKYEDKQILPRKHAEEDAVALYKLFANKKFLGADSSQVKLFLGNPKLHKDAKEATRENILKALKEVSEQAKKDDLVIFGFFGQGAPLGERASFFTVDSTFKNRKKDAIASGDLQPIFDDLKSQRFVTLLDVDFTGFDPGKDQRPDPNLSGFYREFLGKDDATDISRVIFMANRGLKPSVELGEHGAFSQVLLDGLSGKADDEGYEPDGLITVGELAKYVRKKLPDLNRAHGKNDDEKGQVPIILEGQSHDFVVDLNPKVTASVERRLKSFAELAKKNNIPEEVIEEGEDLLHRMPKLEAKQDLRKAYQKLADGALTYADFEKERSKILETTKLNNKELAYYATMVVKATRKVRDEYVEETKQGKLVQWAIDGLFKQVNESIPSSIKDGMKDIANANEVNLLKLLVSARQHLGKREDLAKGKDITYSLHAMLNKLDRHTDYIDPETMMKYLQDIQGSFSGIGVQIRRNNTHDALEVVSPLKDSPAYKAGMYQGDLITKIIRVVDDKGNPLPQPEVIPTKGMTTEQAVKKILGPPGTKVKLKVHRDGVEKEFEIIRGNVELETVMGYKRNKDDTWNYVIDPESKICYVRLTQFSQNTYRDLNNVLKDLYKAGIKGFILDLRFNPGGLLDSAVKISDLFIDDGMVVTIRPRKGGWTSYIGKSKGSYLEFPMVCLVNGYSASGSEIVSACLQDHGRAIVIGSRSYGKGSVQTIHYFETGGRLKLTTATFWRPNGENLNKASTKGREEDTWGVTPNKNFNLKLPAKEFNDLQEFMRWNEIIHRPGVPPKKSDAIEHFEDRQLDMAMDYLRGQIALADGVKKKTGVVSQN